MKSRAPRLAGISRGPVTSYCYLVLAYFVFLITLQGSIVPFLKTDFGLSYVAVGLHASAVAVGAIAVGLLGDRFVRRHGRRPMLLFGIAGCIAGALVIGVAPAAWATIAGCATIGVGGSIISTVAFATLADVHGDKRSIAINEATAVNYGLAVLAPLLTALCVALAFGWRSALLISAGLGAVLLVAFRSVALPEAAGPAAAAAATGGRVRLPAAYWAYWWANSFAVAIEFCILLWSPEFLARVVGLAKAEAALAASAFVLGMFIGRVCGSVTARIFTIERLIIAQLMVALIGFLIYWTVSQPLIAIAGLFILGLGVSLLFPLTIGLAISSAAAQTDAASARSTIAFGAALLIMPALLGALADQAGLSSAHWLVPLLIVATLVAFLIGRMIEKTAHGSVKTPDEAGVP